MTSFSKQGETFGYSVETALGTDSGSFSDIRYQQDSLTIPQHTRTLLPNPNVGHRHAMDKSDKPIPIQAFLDGSLSFSQFIRRSASANTNPPIASFLESAGWTIVRTTVSSVSSYSSVTEFDLGDTGDAYGLPGNFILVRIADVTSDLDNMYYPVLIAAKATDTVNPGMALPAATADNEPIEVMTTMYPVAQVVPSTKTLSFLVNTRGTHTSGEDLAYELAGCSLKSLGEMTIKPNEAPILAYTFHVATVDQLANAIADETFVDSQKYSVITHDCRVELGTSSDSGAISRSDAILMEATINVGFECIPRMAYGNGTLAGIQGYIMKAMVPKITITADFSKDYWDEVEGSNTSKYIGIVQPTSDLATPAFAVVMPKAHIDHESTLVLDRSGDTITATVTYIGSVADYNSETNNAEAGAAPIFFGISGASS